MDKFLGKKLDGRYEIMEIIGIGGMANVYKAYDAIEDRIVAVKILREEYMNNDDMRRRFKNESKAMAVLNHPNVMRVYDVSFSDRMQSIVMEYIDGITLKEYIEQQGVLKWKEAVHFTVQTLRALQHAHDRGIVHRDIKPQNIMLLSDGTIKITDFGIARFARSETRTLTDKAIGSVHYISPEQASGGTVDARTDIYSVGVILYEMLTGRVPFEADTPVSVALKQIQNTAVSPRELNPSIPEGLQEVTMHAMEKDVNKRYQSAAQMLRDIDEFKRDPSILFEYKYLNMPNANDESKYSDAIQNARKTQKDSKSKKDKPRRAPIIPVLAGVTAAFVIVSAAFIGWMVYLNNPFVKVEEVSAPDLVGQKYDNIKISSKYEKFNIIVVDDPVYNNEYGKGVIYEQSPKSGTSIKVNSDIRVKISKGKETVKLPNFTGQDVAQVIAQLKEWGIDYEEKALFDDAIPANSVIKTIPGEGTEVAADEVVAIYVSMGREEKLVTVPDLTGISLNDAKTLLDNYKLKIGKITYDDASEEPEGTIIAQGFAADSQVAQNTLIDITVSGSDQGTAKLQLMIALPKDVNRMVQMSATQDGIEVQKDNVNPSELKTWRPNFEGEGNVEINIFFDGELYQAYELDFDRKGHRLLHDYSSEFTK
ncbi:Stk1 family PASTA domain-containing Ser/Thr kinase [Oscillospiraceae bacterium PP1C4]